MKLITVGLLWHSIDSPNLGVSALTHAQMHLVDQAAQRAGVEARYVLIGWVRPGDGAADARVIGTCQVTGRRLLGIDDELRRAFDACDLVLDIGEGDSFADIYGWKRLLYLTGTKVLAARKGRALVMSPQTIGPFRNPLAARLGDYAMRKALAVCSRDALSTAYLNSRNIGRPVHEAIDVAFALPFEPREREKGRLRVGVNVSGLLWAGGYTGANQFGLKFDYRSTMLELVDRLLSHEGVEVVLVPHVVVSERREEDDMHASRELQALRPQLSIAGPFASPMEAKSYISGLDFFTGARMHACIGAFSAGVPCVPMAYSRKFTGLFNTLEYLHVADCTAESAEAVIERIIGGFNVREALAAQVMHGNRIAADRLDGYCNVLQRLIEGRANA